MICSSGRRIRSLTSPAPPPAAPSPLSTREDTIFSRILPSPLTIPEGTSGPFPPPLPASPSPSSRRRVCLIAFCDKGGGQEGARGRQRDYRPHFPPRCPCRARRTPPRYHASRWRLSRQDVERRLARLRRCRGWAGLVLIEWIELNVLLVPHEHHCGIHQHDLISASKGTPASGRAD